MKTDYTHKTVLTPEDLGRIGYVTDADRLVALTQEDMARVGYNTIMARRLDEIMALLHRLMPEVEGPMARARKRRLRVVKCTQDEFEKLPAMVGASEFLDWTGLSREELDLEVKSGAIAIYRERDGKQARYLKREIARLGGWKM